MQGTDDSFVDYGSEVVEDLYRRPLRELHFSSLEGLLIAKHHSQAAVEEANNSAYVHAPLQIESMLELCCNLYLLY